jgi:polysaccharide biosynthesis/export protein
VTDFSGRSSAHRFWVVFGVCAFVYGGLHVGPNFMVYAGPYVGPNFSSGSSAAVAAAQQTPQQAPVQTPPSVPPTSGTPVAPAPASVMTHPVPMSVPGDYTIGPDDILSIVFWRDKEMSADVVVRPDGRVTLPLVNDVVAAGLTPEQLRDRIREEAAKYVEEPNVTVVVKQINSRKVFISGMVGRPGAYPLSGAITVLQILSLAGVSEFADDKKILIMRTENGKSRALKFNLRELKKGKNLQQNIELKPGDTIVVP